MNPTSKDAVTSLTAMGVHQIVEQQKKNQVVIQILEPEVIQTNRQEQKSLKYKIFISDGKAKYKAVLGNEAAATFEAAGNPACPVVRVIDLMMPQQQNKRLVLVTKIEILYKDIAETVGTPIEYQEWLESGGASKSTQPIPIPSKYLANTRNSGQGIKTNQTTTTVNSTNTNPTTSNFNRNQQPQNQYQNQNQFQNQFQNQNQFQQQPKPQQNFNQQPQASFQGANKFANQNQNFGQKKGPIGFSNPNVVNADKIGDEEFMSFNQLAPFVPFTIRARVSMKSDLKTFQRKGLSGEDKGENQVFSCDLIDKDGNEIQASFFGVAANHFYNILEDGKIYLMMGGTVKIANSKFNRTKSEYQIVFDRIDSNVIIQPMEDKDDIEQIKLEYHHKLSDVKDIEKDKTVDLACFVKDPGQAQEVTIKSTGESKLRRNIQLYDDSKVVLEMTLWGDFANKFNATHDQFILIKGARVGEFNMNKSLSNSYSTKIITDPKQMPPSERIQQLQAWKKNEFKADELEYRIVEGGGGSFFNKGFYTLEEVQTETGALGLDPKDVKYFDCRAMITHIKTEGNLYYPACPVCQKKIQQSSPDTWNCNTCGKMFPHPSFKYSLNLRISDPTNSIWATAFDRVAKELVDKEVTDIKTLKEQADDQSIAEIFKEANNVEFNLRIFGKMDQYQTQEPRPRFQIVRAEKVKYIQDSHMMLKFLNEYAGK